MSDNSVEEEREELDFFNKKILDHNILINRNKNSEVRRDRRVRYSIQDFKMNLTGISFYLLGRMQIIEPNKVFFYCSGATELRLFLRIEIACHKTSWPHGNWFLYCSQRRDFKSIFHKFPKSNF